jgi:cold shock CspA family protein
MSQGTILKFNRIFGFIKVEGQFENVLFHKIALIPPNVDVTRGDRVEFDLALNLRHEGRSKAVNVRRLERSTVEPAGAPVRVFRDDAPVAAEADGVQRRYRAAAERLFTRD